MDWEEKPVPTKGAVEMTDPAAHFRILMLKGSPFHEAIATFTWATPVESSSDTPTLMVSPTLLDLKPGAHLPGVFTWHVLSGAFWNGITSSTIRALRRALCECIRKEFRVKMTEPSPLESMEDIAPLIEDSFKRLLSPVAPKEVKREHSMPPPAIRQPLGPLMAAAPAQSDPSQTIQGRGKVLLDEFAYIVGPAMADYCKMLQDQLASMYPNEGKGDFSTDTPATLMMRLRASLAKSLPWQPDAVMAEYYKDALRDLAIAMAKSTVSLLPKALSPEGGIWIAKLENELASATDIYMAFRLSAITAIEEWRKAHIAAQQLLPFRSQGFRGPPGQAPYFPHGNRYTHGPQFGVSGSGQHRSQFGGGHRRSAEGRAKQHCFSLRNTGRCDRGASCPYSHAPAAGEGGN